MRIDRDRLLGRLGALAEIGRTGPGGVTRLALTAEDGRARAMVLGWARARGFACRRDAIGNLFVRRPGTVDGALPVMTGSHLDTQRDGGNFDGIYGVLAGLEVLDSLQDGGATTRHPFDLAIWNNEEGVRFQPVTMGSGVHAGSLPLDAVRAYRDAAGVTVAQALDDDERALGALPDTPLAAPFHAYVEAHIEQGPILEAQGVRIGIVTGIQGVRQFLFRVRGEAAHAGTTPAVARKDAFVGALALYHRLEALAEVRDPAVRFTVGRFSVSPGTPNTVPGEVCFTVDLRHPDADILRVRGDALLAAARAGADPCAIEATALIHSPPVPFAAGIGAATERAAAALGLDASRLLSGATHDAGNVARLGPTGMIFVPSRDGISHNPREWTDPDDLVAGCAVLARTLIDVDGASREALS